MAWHKGKKKGPEDVEPTSQVEGLSSQAIWIDPIAILHHVLCTITYKAYENYCSHGLVWRYIQIISKWRTFARSTVAHMFTLSQPIETIVNANWPLIYTGSIIPRTLASQPRYSPSSHSWMWTLWLRVSEQLETPQIVSLSWPFTYKLSHNCLCLPIQALNHQIWTNQRG